MAKQTLNAEADLLHPLATLHWERYHTFRYYEIDLNLPIYCAVLEDKVAILTHSYGSCDSVSISSTDLWSWTTITLPYRCMSLTTYQSKFVAVGGSHLTTRKCTNQIFTSYTGLKWEATLPPMPTKRHSTSSVSTKSPEVLVVAGGVGSTRWRLNIVEVLLDNNWSTVAPLPKPCTGMHSTLHNENLYFSGYFDLNLNKYIYTCSCSSLIQSCEKSSKTTAKDTPLWSQFKTPSSYKVIFSYLSYLVCVDYERNIRAYSSVTQSWVEATSTGEFYCMAAAVLPTGEIVYADCLSGVYRSKLSVCSFDPDRRFISKVLSRLEAVMGVQIISVLANNTSLLTTSSGVQLKAEYHKIWGYKVPLPDPRRDPSQYVVEVMSQWSAGHSTRPPTWRHLLEVLRDIGLPELSQQIDTFMKGVG